MVMAKPIDVTSVNAVPFRLLSAFCDTSAENCGESAITKQLQISNAAKKNAGGNKKNKGDSRQQMPDPAKLTNATLALPVLREK